MMKITPFRRRRLRLGLTQRALAGKLGVSQSYLSRIELGERVISRRITLELALLARRSGK